MTGIDYAALYPLLDRHPEEWDQLFEDVRCIERGALEAMSEG